MEEAIEPATNRSTVDRARHGDRDAFEELVRARTDAVYRLSFAILGEEADARDAAQEAFVTAWRQIATLRDAERFDAWFGRVAVVWVAHVLEDGASVTYLMIDGTDAVFEMREDGRPVHVGGTVPAGQGRLWPPPGAEVVTLAGSVEPGRPSPARVAVVDRSGRIVAVRAPAPRRLGRPRRPRRRPRRPRSRSGRGRPIPALLGRGYVRQPEHDHDRCRVLPHRPRARRAAAVRRGRVRRPARHRRHRPARSGHRQVDLYRLTVSRPAPRRRSGPRRPTAARAPAGHVR